MLPNQTRHGLRTFRHAIAVPLPSRSPPWSQSPARSRPLQLTTLGTHNPRSLPTRSLPDPALAASSQPPLPIPLSCLDSLQSRGLLIHWARASRRPPRVASTTATHRRSQRLRSTITPQRSGVNRCSHSAIRKSPRCGENLRQIRSGLSNVGSSLRIPLIPVSSWG